MSITQTMRQPSTTPFSFKGHTHIHIIGDALTPARMWQVKLYTDAEFLAMSTIAQQDIRPLRADDQHLLSMHFGA